jgi:histidinol dehydrogenase
MEYKNNENVTTFTDSIVESVIDKIKSRSVLGIAKYNTTLDRTDFTTTQWIDAAIEEQMDNILYLTRLKKDILLLEEELRAFKTQAMIKERWDEIKQEDENKRLKYKYGTAVADNNAPEPNKEKQPIIIKYTWHR